MTNAVKVTKLVARKCKRIFVIVILSSVLLIALNMFAVYLLQYNELYAKISGAKYKRRLDDTVNEELRTRKRLKTCPIYSPYLKGRQDIALTNIPPLGEQNHPKVLFGGRHHPELCQGYANIAIIIPFRDREENLTVLLYYLHPFLQRQQIDYVIYVVNQVDEHPFNRGSLMNVGFLEAEKDFEYGCFIFHDVDHIPENDHNIYVCSPEPRHMSVATDEHDYNTYVGGVIAIQRKAYLTIQGFSNRYWGWGAEDDDFYRRIAFKIKKITRPLESVATYTVLRHIKSTNPGTNIVDTGKKYVETGDGINDLKYNLVSKTPKKFYTEIRVQLQRGIGVNHGDNTG